MTEAEEKKPVLLINPLVSEKMYQLVMKTDSEIAWHGFVKLIEDHIYYLYDIVLYPQVVTDATVTAPEKEYAVWIERLFNARDDIKNMRFHGHSHVNASVKPSDVDMGYRDNMVKGEKDFYIFVILNKKYHISVEICNVKENTVYKESDISVAVGDESLIKLMCDNTWYTTNYNKYVKTCSTTVDSMGPSITMSGNLFEESLDVDI